MRTGWAEAEEAVAVQAAQEAAAKLAKAPTQGSTALC